MNSLIVGKKRTVYTKNRHNRKINPPPPLQKNNMNEIDEFEYKPEFRTMNFIGRHNPKKFHG